MRGDSTAHCGPPVRCLRTALRDNQCAFRERTAFFSSAVRERSALFSCAVRSEKDRTVAPDCRSAQCALRQALRAHRPHCGPIGASGGELNGTELRTDA